ncbi:MAG: hypothetical protein LBJ17_03815 [Dysgonamonadaceae bacterium]|jgi:hypothetical protein|nr:hypothetical protein [Dysgonamonadaceae bacterium]
MSLWKIPDKDEEKISIIRSAIDREDILPEEERVLLDGEILELKYFIKRYEGEKAVLQQANEDRAKTANQYRELFKNAQMYISHFIQVLQLTVIRGEIRQEFLQLYGLENINIKEPYVIPDLTTEEAVLLWGENIIRGESERMNHGGIPLYNPAIAKVKVHYELFREIIQSLKIYIQNASRYQSIVEEIRNKATEYIQTIWTKVDEKYKKENKDKYRAIQTAYKFGFYNSGEQLNVFN